MSRWLVRGSTQCRRWCGRFVGAALGVPKGAHHNSDSLGKATFFSGKALRPFRETRLATRAPYSYLTIRMVEGHQCHRVGHAHRKELVGQRFIAQSPNGRFTEGAAAINQQLLTRIEVHGKNLFYFFGEGDATVVLHIHFGMSGAFRTVAREETLPEPRETTRLVLIGDDIVGQLSAMIVQHGGLDLYEEKKGNLGPDPLREDADKELLWERMRKSKASVGLLLMDQKAVAGIGNIYRAEILYKAKVHPEQPGYSVDRETFERIWFHSVDLLQRGFKSGSILTVDPEDARKLGKPWTRRYIYNHKACGRCGMSVYTWNMSPRTYIYNHKACGRCGTSVRTWDMSARTCYACEVCQPLQQGTILDAKRTKALSAAKNSKVFDSHCAPEPVADMQPEQLTIAKLKDRLKELNLPLNGRKAELVERLKAALQSAETLASEEKVIGVEDALENVAEAAAKVEGVPELAPGTLHVGKMMSAKEAALEKAQAGEGRNVEHVALEDDATLALASAQQPKRRKRKQAPEAEQNGAAPKASQPEQAAEQAAEPRRARQRGKQLATAAKEEPAEASAADADKLEATLPKRRVQRKAAAAQQDIDPVAESPLAKAASGKLNMRQRRSARVAAGPALPGKSSRVRGISGGLGLDTPYDWGKQS